jgi:hypothetical protein
MQGLYMLQQVIIPLVLAMFITSMLLPLLGSPLPFPRAHECKDAG